jgi:hypothetical protein
MWHPVWRKEYNEERTHSSLGYRAPAAFARVIADGEGRGKDGGFTALVPARREPLSHSLGDGVPMPVAEQKDSGAVV